MAIHPELPCSFAIQTPVVGHRNKIGFTHGVPLGGSRRSSRHSQGRGVFSQNIFIDAELHATGRSSDGAILARNTRAGMLGRCGSLQHSRRTLPQQQPTADKLQVKCGQRVPLNLSTSMCPLFPTSITYMGAMFMTSVVVFIQMGGMTVVANNVLHDTSLLQCSDGSIDALFQRELRCNTLKIFRTKRSILVGQE